MTIIVFIMLWNVVTDVQEQVVEQGQGLVLVVAVVLYDGCPGWSCWEQAETLHCITCYNKIKLLEKNAIILPSTHIITISSYYSIHYSLYLYILHLRLWCIHGSELWRGRRWCKMSRCKLITICVLVIRLRVILLLAANINYKSLSQLSDLNLNPLLSS